MKNYKYTVVNENNQKLSGFIEANSKKQAKEKLAELSFSIISLELSKEAIVNDVSKSIIKYEFEGFDQKLKKVHGTIKAPDESIALNRLKNEYNLEISTLKDTNTGEEIKLQELEESQEKITEEKEIKRTKAQKNFLNTLNKVLNEVNEIVTENIQLLNADTQKEVTEKINEILRIKNSTNIKHLENLVLELLDKIESEKNYKLDGNITKVLAKIKVKTGKLKEQIKVSKNSNKKKSTISSIIELINKRNKKEDKIEKEIQEKNTQIIDNIKTFFSTKEKNIKDEIKKTISKLWKEKKTLKKKKNIIKKTKSQEKKKTDHHILSKISIITGWLLGLFLIFYFISTLVITKDFSIQQIPNIFFVYNSSIFIFALIIILVFHSSTNIIEKFTKKTKNEIILTYAISAIFCLFVIFNL